MTDREFVLDALRSLGKEKALSLQERAPDMTGTQVVAAQEYLPAFTEAVKVKNMKERGAGFVCLSPEGRAVRLIQPYDSDIYTQAPEELPAQWGFYWSTDPDRALPFIALSTSPYNKGDCCTEGGEVWRSLIDGNVHAPSAYPQGWEKV